MLLSTIWPIFALILVGYGLARAGFPSSAFWPGAERINYFLFFPALLVTSLSAAPIGDPSLLRLGFAAAATIAIGAAAVYAARLIHPARAARFGAVMQGVIRFNTYLGLAIVASLGGGQGIGRAAVLLAVSVPLVNLLSILALSDGGGAGRGRVLLRAVLGNPLILACAAGIALAWSGVGLPFGAERFLGLVAQASLPLGLLCVGAALRPAALRQEAATIGANGALRLLGMPVLAHLVATALGLGSPEHAVLVIFAAIPTAPTSYVLARQLGGDGTLMAGIVTFQTIASAATIPFVLALLEAG